MKGKERFQIAIGKDTKTGDAKVGGKVTVKYKMHARRSRSRTRGQGRQTREADEEEKRIFLERKREAARFPAAPLTF